MYVYYCSNVSMIWVDNNKGKWQYGTFGFMRSHTFFGGFFVAMALGILKTFTMLLLHESKLVKVKKRKSAYEMAK